MADHVDRPDQVGADDTLNDRSRLLLRPPVCHHPGRVDDGIDLPVLDAHPLNRCPDCCVVADIDGVDTHRLGTD